MTAELHRADWKALNTAARRLVEDVGGLDAAAACCRLARSSLARQYSPHHAEMMPIDVVATLEQASGTAPVTQVLARLCGHGLVRLHHDHSEPELLRRLGDVMRHTGAACASGVEAMADGVLTSEECSALASNLHDVVTAASSLMVWLQQHGRMAGTPVES